MKPTTINDLIKHLQEAADKFGGDKEVVFWLYNKPLDDLVLRLAQTEYETSFNRNFLNLQLRFRDNEKNFRND
jgi:hypothetical protein